VLRYAGEGWEISAGSAHGLPVATEGIRVGVPGHRPAREAEVTRVLTERSLARPVGGWTPERDEQFRVVLTAVGLPATTVAVTGDPATAERLLEALGTAGPGGGPSPHVRPVPDGDTVVPELHAVAGPDVVRLSDLHRAPVGDEIPDVAGAGARRAVEALEHVARWRQIRELANPLTQLKNDVIRVEIVEAGPGQVTVPETAPAKTPEADGGYHLSYRRGPDGWLPPHIFIRLHNTGPRKLFCVLLDLTERFRIHATLFPGEFIGPDHVGAALRGRRVEVSLPDGMAPQPGRCVTDWLKLFVAEEQFSAEPFEMPALGRPAVRTARGALGARGLLERLGAAVAYRDMGPAEDDVAYDWTTSRIRLITSVPDS
jgi:hypothetical protein